MKHGPIADASHGDDREKPYRTVLGHEMLKIMEMTLKNCLGVCCLATVKH